jgi:hypothetical protein
MLSISQGSGVAKLALPLIVALFSLTTVSSSKPDSNLQAATADPAKASPEELGRARAAADIKAGTVRILYYGKPWSLGKPLVDDATGLKVEIMEGCVVTAEFVAETDAYNAAMREWARQPNHPAGKPALSEADYVRAVQEHEFLTLTLEQRQAAAQRALADISGDAYKALLEKDKAAAQDRIRLLGELKAEAAIPRLIELVAYKRIYGDGRSARESLNSYGLPRPIDPKLDGELPAVHALKAIGPRCLEPCYLALDSATTPDTDVTCLATVIANLETDKDAALARAARIPNDARRTRVTNLFKSWSANWPATWPEPKQKPAAGQAATITPEEFMVRSEKAMAAVAARCKDDATLKPLANVQTRRASYGTTLVLVAGTPDLWEDVPADSTRTFRSGGYVAVSAYTKVGKDWEPGTPRAAPVGCFYELTWLWSPESPYAILVTTRTSDDKAQGRLTRIAEEEFARAGIAMPEKGPLPLSPLRELGFSVTRDAGAPGNPVVLLKYSGPSKGAALSDAAMKEFGRLTGLKYLDLTGVKVTDAVLEAVCRVEGLEELTCDEFDATGVSLKVLGRLQHLRDLRLRGGTVTDACLKDIGNLKGLRRLLLESTAITDVGAKEIGQLGGLQTLILSGSKLTDAGLKDIARNGGLQELGLRRTGITDAGLAELKDLWELWELDINGTAVTDAGLKELKGLPKLRALNVVGTKVTDDGVKELRKTMPSYARVEGPAPSPPRTPPAIRYD